MRRSQFSSFWSLILVCVVQAGCANTPAVSNLTNWIPGRAEKVNPQALDAQLSLARLSERHGDPGTAEKIYQAALKKDPQNQLAHHRLGVLAAKTGQLDRAAEYLDAAARLGPPSAALLNDIGYNLLMLERLPEAEAAFRHALEIDPQNKSAHNNLGLVLGQTGRYAESLAEFRQAGSEDEAQANLAYAKTRAGDLQGAQSAYHRALSLNQELKPAAEALIQLAQQAPPPGAAPVPSEANCERTPRMSESRRFGTGATDRHAGMNSNLAGRDQDAKLFEAIQPGTPQPAGAEQTPQIPAASVTPLAMGTERQPPSLQADPRDGQTPSGFVPATVFRFAEGSQSNVTTEIHRRQADPASVAAAYESPRPEAQMPSAVGSPTGYPVRPSVYAGADDSMQNPTNGQVHPAVYSATSMNGGSATPSLFPSLTSAMTVQPWQAPTWTPDVGGMLAPQEANPTPPAGGAGLPPNAVANPVQ